MNVNELSAEALAVIEKVKKLLALAEGNSNENEAASASAKAMELLAAYNLNMTIIGSTAKGKQGARSDTKKKGGLYSWQRDLWKAVSELNFCMYWSIKGTARGSTYEHRVLGSQANVISTEVMAEYLQHTVERLAQEWAKPRYRSVFVREAIAYREGMAYRLVQRLNALRIARLDEDARKKNEEAARNQHPNAATSNALVLADVIESEHDYNLDYLHNLEPGTSARIRAESKARQAAAQAAVDEALRAKKQWRLDNPELAAEEDRLAQEASEKFWSQYTKKNSSRTKRAGREPVVRERAPTEQEKRRNLRAFDEGRAKGDEVGLDTQVGRDKRAKIT